MVGVGLGVQGLSVCQGWFRVALGLVNVGKGWVHTRKAVRRKARLQGK